MVIRRRGPDARQRQPSGLRRVSPLTGRGQQPTPSVCLPVQLSARVSHSVGAPSRERPIDRRVDAGACRPSDRSTRTSRGNRRERVAVGACFRQLGCTHLIISPPGCLFVSCARRGEGVTRRGCESSRRWGSGERRGLAGASHGPSRGLHCMRRDAGIGWGGRRRHRSEPARRRITTAPDPFTSSVDAATLPGRSPPPPRRVMAIAKREGPRRRWDGFDEAASRRTDIH